MEQKKKLTIILVLAFGLLGAFFYFWDTHRTGEELHVQQDAKNIIKEFEKEKQREEKIISAAEAHHVEDLGYVEHSHNENDIYTSPKGTIKYLFGTAISGNPDLFSASFEFDMLAKDISKAETPEEKIKLIKEIMKRITRNGKLKDVGYLGADEKGDTTEVKVVLTYQDKKKVPLTINLVALPDPHDNKSIYYVNTSAWDLIEQIEK
jgi:hypothetical protein